MAARLRAPSLALVSALVAAVVPVAAGAQGNCLIEIESNPSVNTRLAVRKDTAASRVAGRDLYDSFAGGGVIAHCSGQNVTLRADSAEYYSTRGTLFLIGKVSYTEPRVRVNSQRMTYYQGEDRLLAQGSVDAVLPSGTSMQGPQADYYREIPNVRPRARLIAPGRPRFNIVQTDSTGRQSPPTALVADRVVTDGDSLVYAGGRVEIDRTDLSARGDSAFLDSGSEFGRLMRTPSIIGKGQRSFTLRGATIDIFSRQRQLQRVLALAQAEAVSQDLKLNSDTIDLRMAASQIERAYAWGKSRAHATSPERDIVADSIDARLPGQRVREVRAVRDAYATTVADTARFKSTERDWLRGDTIVAQFDSTAPTPQDTSSRPRVRSLVALGSARSYYQLAPAVRDSLGRPAVNYVRGRNITVAFDGQRVQTVTVIDRAAGVYLEPGESASSGSTSSPGTTPTRSPGSRSGPPRGIPTPGRRP